MSQNPNLTEDDFKFVPFRKKGKKLKNIPIPKVAPKATDFNKASALRRIETACTEIAVSDLLSSTFASLREGLILLNNPEIQEIICLGLGHIGERMVSAYQLALLICLKNEYNVTVQVHDPIFLNGEKELLKELGFVVLEQNLEGKYQVQENSATIFYFPHCSKQLTNNLLWSNWSLNIRNCIIIGNSFNSIVENSTKRQLTANAGYIVNILPYLIELPMINTFKFYNVFNDTAIHVFPFKKLCLIPEDFWKDFLEPKYVSDSIEFITNEFVNIDL